MTRKTTALPLPPALGAAVAAALIALAAPQPASAAGAATASIAPQSRVHTIALSTGLVDGKMVFLGADGKPNPTLRGRVGDTIEITIASGEGAQHDIVFPELNVASEKFDASTGAKKLRFKLTQAGRFAYICSIAGHRQIGMEGVLEVTGGDGVVPVTTAAVKPVKAKKNKNKEKK